MDVLGQQTINVRDAWRKDMIERLRHWIFEAKKKKCKHCCLWCEFWDLCKGDEQ